ncbi:MAG TPA: glycosyltransferase family 39 protein [Chloroflexota bacterium]|nr:glycosyltransferase family 39 protein [Chloroflexota bacterium]
MSVKETSGDARRQVVAVAAGLVLVLGAFVLRIYRIDSQSLWPDEVYSLVLSHWSIGQTWTQIVNDHVPLYTLLLGEWRPLVGTSAFSLRFFSAIFSTLSVPLTLILARRFLRPSAAYVAAMLVAISPFQVYYAQEVVMYSLLGALALLSSWLLLRWAARPGLGVVILQSVLYGAMAYTHYAGLFVLATHVAIVVVSWLCGWFQPRDLTGGLPVEAPVFSRRWVWTWLGGMLLFLPWVATHVHAMASNVAGGTSRTVIDLLALTFTDLSFGNAIAAHLDAGIPFEAAVLQRLAWASLLLPAFCILAIVPRRRGGRWRISWDHLVALLHAVIPFAVLLVLVQFTRDFVSRYGFPATFWFPIAAVAGLWYLRPVLRWLGVALLVVYCAWGGLLYFQHPGFARLDFRDAVAYIVQHRRPGDAVIVTAPYVASTFDYYVGPAAGELPRTPLPATVPMNVRQTQQALSKLDDSSQRLWLLRWQDYYSDPHRVIANWLGAHAIHERTLNFPGDLAVELWLTRPPVRATLPPDTTTTSAEIGHTMHLAGLASRRSLDGPLVVTFYWRLSAPLTDDYTVFVHLVDQSGRRVAQADAPPYEGQYSTTRWPVGPIVQDVHRISLPTCLPPGRYRLDVGFYVLKTMRRLGSPGDDTFHLSVVVPPMPANPLAHTLLWRLPPALRLDPKLPPSIQVGCPASLPETKGT